MSITTSLVDVDPSTAKRFLAKNVKNRGTKPAAIAKYARDMANGKWQLTGESIKFDTNGAMIDGQNRCHAVISSGAVVKMFVVHGLEPETQDVMDTGVSRTAADVLTMHGHKNAAIISSIAGAALKTPELGLTQVRIPSPSHSDIQEFINANPDIHPAGVLATRLKNSTGIRPSVLGAVYMRLNRVDPGDCLKFFESLHTMDFDGPQDPRAVLRVRLNTMMAGATKRADVTQPILLFLLIRTWNAWRTGEQITHFVTQRDSRALPIPTPV